MTSESDDFESRMAELERMEEESYVSLQSNHQYQLVND